MYEEVKQIEYQEALDFLMPKHYAGRKPQITKAFGWFIDNKLVAVCTFGKPSTPRLCEGVCGKQFSDSVYELNRLVRVDDLNRQLSWFIGKVLRMLKSENWIIVSYSDSGMSHHGYIYQACNFLYTGCTKQRTDKYIEGKHARHAVDNPNGIRQIRTSKYRYIYFCTSDKKLKKKWLDSLNYEILPYPKGDNENYQLGNIYKPVLIDKNKHIVKQDGFTMKIQNERNVKMKTSEIFEREIGYIVNPTMKKIVAETLDSAPECIQVIPASSSGRYHPEADLGEGGLNRHVKAVTGIANCLIGTEIFKNLMLGFEESDTTLLPLYADAVYSACILHDCMKPDDTPKHSTVFDHPLRAAKLFKEIASKYINESNMEYMKIVVPLIYKGIASHMGQWSTAPYAKGIVLPKPSNNFEEFVHMCDYIASRKFIDFNFKKYEEGKN